MEEEYCQTQIQWTADKSQAHVSDYPESCKRTQIISVSNMFGSWWLTVSSDFSVVFRNLFQRKYGDNGYEAEYQNWGQHLNQYKIRFRKSCLDVNHNCHMIKIFFECQYRVYLCNEFGWCLEVWGSSTRLTSHSPWTVTPHSWVASVLSPLITK